MIDSSVDFLNETEFENDPFATVEEDVTERHPKYIIVLQYYLIIVTLLKLILILVVIAANIFLVIVIVRFKRLRAVRSNMYILNLSLLNIVYYLCSPLFYTICHIFKYEMASALVLQTQMTLLTLYVTFAVGMAVDWFVSVKCPLLTNKIEKYYRYSFIGVYVLFFIEWSIAFIYSEVHHVARSGIFLIFYSIYLIILIVVNISKICMRFRNEIYKTEYALITANVIILSFVPIFVFHLLYIVVPQHVTPTLLFGEIVPEIIEIGHPILVIYLLGRKNKYFQMAYYKSLKRSRQNYQDDDLDVISEDNTRNSVTNGLPPISLNGIQDDI